MTKVNLKELQNELKFYENKSQKYLDPNQLIAIRLDMRSGGKFVKGLDKPWDEAFSYAMEKTAKDLLEEVTGTVISYTGSDEITLIIYPTNEDKEFVGEQIPFFNGRVDKVLSLSASIATLAFNKHFLNYTETALLTPERKSVLGNKLFTAQFDSRVFQIPSAKDTKPLEGLKVVFSRMNDVRKNSIQMLGRAHFSHKQLQGVSTKNILEMLKDKGVDWEKEIHTNNKYGVVYFKEFTLKHGYNPVTNETTVNNRKVVTKATEEEIFEFVNSKEYSELFGSQLSYRIMELGGYNA